jgi:hypothetical protein
MYRTSRCDNCVLAGFTNDSSEFACPVQGDISIKELEGIWEKHKGELLIAFIQFNEGFE